MRVVRKLFRSCLPGDRALGVGVLDDVVAREEVLIIEVEETPVVDTETLEEGEGVEIELVSTSMVLEVVRNEDVVGTSVAPEVVSTKEVVTSELVSSELLPFPLVEDRTSGPEEFTVDEDMSVVGFWEEKEDTKELLEDVTELTGTTSTVELAVTFTAFVLEAMSLDTGMAGCVYKEMLLHPRGTPVPRLSVLLSHT